MRRTWRVPMLLLLPVLVVAAVVVQDRHDVGGPAVASPDQAVAAVADASAPASTWYCAAGTATAAADAYGEQSVIVSNTNDVESTGIVTVFSDSGTQASRAITVKAHGSTTVRSAEVLKAPWVATVVEMSGGGVAVAQELRGAAGRAVDDCATAPADSWWFPSGTTRAGVRLSLALFNPFPGEATVDVQFDTEEGTRAPQQLQGMVVRGGHVAVVDVSAIVTLRERVSTTVSVRAGRIVAEQVQSADGRNGTESGLSAWSGATIAAPVWSFPVSTPATMSAREIVAVTNTGDIDTDVQVEVQLDDPATNGTVEPFVASVPARRSITIDLAADPRLPKGVGRWYVVRSMDGRPIVASRTIAVPRAGSVGGLAITSGVPVVATTWFGAFPVPGETATSFVAVANPNATRPATVRLSVSSGGRSKDVTGAVDVTIAPGRRLVVDLQKVTSGRSEGPYELVSDVPVVVGQWLSFTAPVDVSTLGALPLAGTVSFPVDVFESGEPEIPGPSLRTDDTTATSSTTSTTSTTIATVPASATTVAVN